MSLFSKMTFLPSLGYNLLRNRWSTWNWFDRIDEQLVIGALPFFGPVTHQLYHSERIRAVVSMNEDFELFLYVTNHRHWNKLNVPFLQLRTSDIFHAPTLDQLSIGVNFILEQQKKLREHQDSNDCLALITKNEMLWPIRNQGKTLTIEGRDDFDEYNLPSIYVHCKAGRTRSATLVACYLIERYAHTPNEAIEELVRKRPQILLQKRQL
ncbi:nuclear envelope phosphatase-regulatory subunit 1-like, partial [Sarcoptes scabiei]